MTKQMRTLFYCLVGLVAVLAFTTAFFYAKSRSSKNASVTSSKSPSTTSTEAGTNPSPQASSAVSRPATNKPSTPGKTYTIQINDTLFGIAKSQGVTMAELSEANGITDADRIQAGQVLSIPENGQVGFSVDSEKAASLQEQVDQGQSQWRLAPDETARADAPTVYGLKVSDSFTVKSRDDQKGMASVQASSELGNFLITLSQPVTKGQKGIWAIDSIKKI